MFSTPFVCRLVRLQDHGQALEGRSAAATVSVGPDKTGATWPACRQDSDAPVLQTTPLR